MREQEKSFWKGIGNNLYSHRKYRKVKITVAFLLIFVLTLSMNASVGYYAQEAEDDEIEIADGFDPWTIQENELLNVESETTYFDLLEEYTAQANTTDELNFNASENLVSLEDEQGNEIENSGSESVVVPARTMATYSLDIPSEGVWHIGLRYKVTSENIVDLKLNLTINGEKPFFEANDIAVPAMWETVDESRRIDQYNNEVYPTSQRIHREFETLLNNDMFQLEQPLLFSFESGENEITLLNNELEYELLEISLFPLSSNPTYSEFMTESNPELANADPVIIEAEDFTEKNRVHIRGERTKNYNYNPYSPSETLINILAPAMWQNPGDQVSYTFDVAEDGYYEIGFKFLQDQKRDMPVYKNIYLDGEILFDEMQSYPFAFTGSNIQTRFLGDDTDEFVFFLEAGEHTLSLESSASNFYIAYEALSRVVAEMNQLTLDIRTITGNRVDTYRDWNIETYIPDLSERLQAIIDTLDDVFVNLNALSNQENVSTWNTLSIISDQMENYLVEKDGLDDLVNNLDGFSQEDGSMAQQISNIIDQMLMQPLTIDQIYIVGQDRTKLPDGVSFIERLGLSTEKFIWSFRNVENQDFSVEDDENVLNIWINRPVTHIDVLREMINQSYPNKDIEINLSAMPDENRLLLAIIGGDAPDGVLGLSTGKPYDFALRGAAYDLTNFDDFSDSVADFTSEMFVPFAHDGGIYAFPETTTFHVLFYRTDILQQLGLEVPQTWEDLIGTVPTLDRHGMNIQTMIAASDAYKPFGATVPIIQQNGGEVYSEDGLNVAFSDPKTLEAFELLTDLYIKYNLPHRIVNFYNNFKSGATPLGVSELNTYTLLKYAAPEIRGQWAIAPNIGMYDENGEFVNTQPVVTSSAMITQQSNNKEEMWEFMKWWMDSETQLQYGNELQMRFGREFIWSSANVDTIANAPYFEIEDREVILEQIMGAREVQRHPAYFQVERELSNAWNSVVFDGVSVREAMDRAAISSNRVMLSKLQEFGYVDADGRVLKEIEMTDAEDIRELGIFADEIYEESRQGE